MAAAAAMTAVSNVFSNQRSAARSSIPEGPRLLSPSACLFKGSKPIRKSRNINGDVVCGGRAGIDIVWKKEVNRFFSGGIPFFKE
jgi:hypothetical protein